MTRKCVICQNKNYKNSCSFFSAPKDAKIRCLWQKAINIKDYIVSDDTYVCSKHFSKNDIITHWVSGIPPKVITVSLQINNMKYINLYNYTTKQVNVVFFNRLSIKNADYDKELYQF